MDPFHTQNVKRCDWLKIAIPYLMTGKAKSEFHRCKRNRGEWQTNMERSTPEMGISSIKGQKLKALCDDTQHIAQIV